MDFFSKDIVTVNELLNKSAPHYKFQKKITVQTWGFKRLFVNWCLLLCNWHLYLLLAGMLKRPAGHEAKAEARKSEAEDEAEVQNFFRGRDHNVWGRGQTR